jgi:uncharacterized protein (TIGR02118 family)
MYKAIGIWTWPKDEDMESFERHYETTHYPLAEKLPEIERITLLKAGPEAKESGIFRVAEVYWPDEASFQRASVSEEWAAMAEDAAYMSERYGVELKAATGFEQAS